MCSDMWKPYLNVIAETLDQAVHVLDRFHVMRQFGEAARRGPPEESRRLVRDGYEPVLKKKSRWCFLTRPENLTEKQTVKLSEVLKYNLRTVRAYLLREEFQRVWEYKSAWWAGIFLDEWTGRVMRSRLEPMKKIARSIRRSSAIDPELVPGPRPGFVSLRRRGAQQQGDTGDEKVVRISDGESRLETGSIAQPRPPPRAKTHPTDFAEEARNETPRRTRSRRCRTSNESRARRMTSRIGFICRGCGQVPGADGRDRP